METTKTNTRQDIIQGSLDHTLFSWSKQGGLQPNLIDRAEGVYLYEADGKRFIDFSSQLMNVNIGHGHPRITEAVSRQMKKVSYVYPGMVTEVRTELGEMLAEIVPVEDAKTLFTLGGSEAIENAVKIARFYTGRHKVISHARSYHGATNGALSVSGDPRRHPIDTTIMPGIVHAENPYFYRCPWDTNTPEACRDMAIRNLERMIQYENPDQIAAILVEGESGTSGCIKYPPLYLKMIRELADKYGIVLIVDEVMSGFGRTGKWFGATYHGVQADIVCLAKGLTSGYIPMGATVVSGKIAAHFNDRVLAAGLTYSAHAVSCAAAVETIKVMRDEGLVENAAKMGAYMDKRAAEMMQIHPSIGDWRNTGLLGCFELVKNRKTKEPIAPWNAKPAQMDISNRINAKLRELGLFTFVRWNWIFVAPPLCINEEQIEEGLAILSKAISIADEAYES